MNRKHWIALTLPALLVFALMAHALGGARPAIADTPTPGPASTNTPVPGPVAIAITPATAALSCGAPTTISISVQQGGVSVPNGTTVQINANAGLISTGLTVTNNGTATVNYTSPPPNFNGPVTITVIALGTAASTNINIICGSAPGPVPGPFNPVPPAVLGVPSVICAGPTASVTFNWQPANVPVVPGVTLSFVDLSLANNGFVPGTFISFGPLAANTGQIVWNGILAGQPTYWRVNTLTQGNGWVTSTTGSFTPCGPAPTPFPLQPPAGAQVTYACTGGGTANVTFNWGQPASGFSNFLDISLANNGFAPGTFIGVPVSGQSQYTWQGILANVPTYWRVNSLGASGWTMLATGSFVAAC